MTKPPGIEYELRQAASLALAGRLREDYAANLLRRAATVIDTYADHREECRRQKHLLTGLAGTPPACSCGFDAATANATHPA
jgi:hypothetical protein